MATIFKRMFRVYAHIYHCHFEQVRLLNLSVALISVVGLGLLLHFYLQVVSMGAEAHLNTCFKHFVYFVMEFDLVRTFR